MAPTFGVSEFKVARLLLDRKAGQDCPHQMKPYLKQ